MTAPKNSRESSTLGSSADMLTCVIVKDFAAEEIFVKPRAGTPHFDEARQDCRDEEPTGKGAVKNHDEERCDEEVEQKPERGIDDRGVVVDRGVDVIALIPGKNGEEQRETEVEACDRAGESHVIGGSRKDPS